MKMSTKELNYESYCISSYESETSLESLRETGHPLLGEFEMLLNVKFPQTGKDSSKRGEIILCLSHGIPLTSA